MKLILRIISPDGKKSVKITIDDDAIVTFNELKTLCFEAVGLQDQPLSIDLVCGFPPSVCTANGSDIIVGIIKNNETIRLQYESSAGKQAVSTTPIKKSRAVKQVATKASSSIQHKFGSNIASLHNNNSNNRKASSKEIKIRRIRNNTASSEGDVADHLLAAVSVGSKGSRSKILRKVFRDAVSNQYNQVQSVTRLEAAYSGNYTITESTSSHVLGSGLPTQMDVTYKKGAGRRSAYTETIDIISVTVLRAVLLSSVNDEEGHGRELLKPINLSKASPRIFWSIVKHYGPNIPNALKMIIPEVTDWSWLHERKRELSEKAMENLRQHEEKQNKKSKKRKGGDSSTNENDCIIVISDSQVTNNSITSIDIELLKVLNEENISSIIASEMQLSVVIGVLPSNNIIVELANIIQYSDAILQQFNQCNDGSNSTSSNSNTLVPSVDQIDSWGASAQSVVVRSFWRYVCSGCLRFYLAIKNLLLRNKSPYDLLVWKRAPKQLVELLNAADSCLLGLKLQSTDGVGLLGTSRTINEKYIEWMCDTAEGLCAHCTWVENYSGRHDDDEDEVDDGDDDEDDDANEADVWTVEHEFVGKKVRVLMDFGFWEEGIVIGYLPATADEPLALFKVQVDESISDSSSGNSNRHQSTATVDGREFTGRFEDLELHEVIAAIGRYT